MKIRTALTLKNTCVTAAVLLLCMTAVYVVSERTRRDTFYHNLRKEAVTKAHFLLNDKADARMMQSAYRNNMKFIDEVEVAIYTPGFSIVYHDSAHSDIVKETPQMIRRIMKEGQTEFAVGRYQAIGMVYPYGGRDYIVTAAAYDGYGHANLRELRHTLAMLFLAGLSLLFAACYFLARAALRPVRDIVGEAEAIGASDTDRRLPVANAHDELGELCMAFNGLLGRLQRSLDSQKMFVSNVVHELRTPLAALTAEIDIALQKDRSAGQYRAALENALGDARRMGRLADGLLNLARADYARNQVRMERLRIDELLLDVRDLISRAHPDYRIQLVFEHGGAEDESAVSVMGNAHLLVTAFANLIENNCKYAPDHSSFVQISSTPRDVVVRMSDNGPGMSEDEVANIFKPFYRGGDTAVRGNGIGMTLASKVINMHGGEIAVYSEKGRGTTFVVNLRHV